MFFHRPLRCVIAIHPYPFTQRDTDQLAKSACLSCVKICVGDPHSKTDLRNYKHVTLHMTQKSELSSSAAFITETNHATWNLLISTVSLDRTIAYMMIPATKASKKAFGYSFQIFDPGKWITIDP